MMKCDICGETVTELDIDHGNVAEMFDPNDTVSLFPKSGIVHTECGLSWGWEVS